MFCAGTGNAPGKNFASFRYKTSDKADVLVIDIDFIRAKTADFLFYGPAAAELPSGCSRACTMRAFAGALMK